MTMSKKISEQDAVSHTVHIVGKIDLNIYKRVSPDIITDEVVITEKQIEHIKKRHPADYERFLPYLGEIVSEPDYILEANKPNTALILKKIEENGEIIKIILRLIAAADNPDYKNSIITLMRVKEKDWNRLIRNKKILYKRE